MHSGERLIRAGSDPIIIAEDRSLSIDLDNRGSSLCSINRPGFGQFEHVEITFSSIKIQFDNLFSNLQCSSISIDAFITNTHTHQLERTIEVNWKQTIMMMFFCSL